MRVTRRNTFWQRFFIGCIAGGIFALGCYIGYEIGLSMIVIATAIASLGAMTE